MNLIKRFVNFYQHQDTILFWSTSLSILFALFLIFIFLLNLDSLPNQIPFFYSLSWGDSQLAQKGQFIILPALIILTTLINLIVTWHLHSSQLTMKRIIMLTTLIIALFTTLSGLRIIYTLI